MFLASILNSSGQAISVSGQILSWFYSHGIKVLIILVVAWVITRIVKIFFYRLLKKVIRKGLSFDGDRSKGDAERARTVSRVVVSISKAVIWALAMLTVLPEFGVNTAPLLASLGVIGLALGLGARSLIQDYLSGLFILLEDQYRVGEDVNVSGAEGVVADFNLRRTVVRSKDKVLHYIPNSQIKKASNFSRKKK